MIAAFLGQVAHHGRFGLVAGLAAGLALPDAALALRPWLPELIGLLLAVTALRIGPRAAFGSLAEFRGTLRAVAVFQMLLPCLALLLFRLAGHADTAIALIAVLWLAAPSVTGSPNFAILLGQPPAPALRLLVLGTALFPLTALPVFWLLPALGGAAAAFGAAGWLMTVIALSVGAGFLLRRWVLPAPDAETVAALDGIAVILLAVVVVGLMSALGPALAQSPVQVAGWLVLACVLNWGAQALTLLVLKTRPERGPFGVVAGNRNIALFLIALPPEITDPLLIFIGCYQIPMYLTPIVMQRLYRRASAAD
ncbi:hypothetical protein QO034_10290 [Sedimentitalea sp. JM2-8]|uniref:Bile acid:Na+ symporter, BASS family n=1 Tax=Sedimentitalea xiamensis TaxID=3050037 RepID=A0ABT7FEL1_9RHOB|nr:hypothetical protein [Sedimentitalea xiamensis]MDK3073500.1 hypothetical protein [Sedimentitalea xiamensis]